MFDKLTSYIPHVNSIPQTVVVAVVVVAAVWLALKLIRSTLGKIISIVIVLLVSGVITGPQLMDFAHKFVPLHVVDGL